MQNKKIIGVAGIGVSVIILALLLRPVFSGQWILPQSIPIGPLTLRLYGLCLALAALSGYWLASRRAARYGVSTEQLDSMFLWLVIASFVGARLYHVASSFSYYTQHPLETVMVWRGGLSIYGVFIGGLIGLFFLARRPHLRTIGLARLLDFAAPCIVLGQAIGRFGNFFNYELMGYPTGLAWKMFVPENFRPLGYESVSYFHPLFLYESLASALILVFLLYLERKNTRSHAIQYAPGTLFLWYFFLYNIVRFFLEFLRIQSTYAAGIRVNALVSAVFALLSLVFLVYRYARKIS